MPIYASSYVSLFTHGSIRFVSFFSVNHGGGIYKGINKPLPAFTGRSISDLYIS